MNKKKISILFLIIVSVIITGCGKTYKTDYLKKFDKYLEYSLGNYKINVYDEEIVVDEIGIGFDYIPISYDRYSVWNLEYIDKNGSSRTLVFDNYTRNHKENLATAVLFETEEIAMDTIDSEVIKKKYPNINTESNGNFVYYSTKVRVAEDAKSIKPSKVLNKKNGIKLSEIEPKTLVEKYGYEYYFEVLYMGTDETLVPKVTEEYKETIIELADYLNQDIIKFKFYKAFDVGQSFAGVYNKKSNSFEIIEFTENEYNELNLSWFEYQSTSEEQDNIYDYVSVLSYVDRLVRETINESESVIVSPNIEVRYSADADELTFYYELTTEDIWYYTEIVGIEVSEIGDKYKTLITDVVDKLDYNNILIEYNNIYNLKYSYNGKYNANIQDFDINYTYTEKEDKYTEDGHLKVFSVGDPTEVMINGEFTHDMFKGDIIYNEEKQEYYPTAQFIEYLLSNTIAHFSEGTFYWTYNKVEYKLIKNRDSTYELYKFNELIFKFSKDINDVLSVSDLEKITGINIVLNNNTEGIELLIEDVVFKD